MTLLAWLRRPAVEPARIEPAAELTLASNDPTGRSVGVRVARDRATTAHVASLYPWHGGRTLAAVPAPYVGANMTDGESAFHFCPFALYRVPLGGGAMLTNSNMLVVGEPGVGKSSSVKVMIARHAAFWGSHRFFAITDPKGEYGPLADLLRMPRVKLFPGAGGDRLNPLDPGPGDPSQSLLNRQELLVGLLGLALRRELSDVEEAAVIAATVRLDDATRGHKPATLIDLARLLTEPQGSWSQASVLSSVPADTVAVAVAGLRLGLDKMLTHTLRGMFDGPSTRQIDWTTGQGIVIDLSAVFGNKTALPLVQMAAGSWLAAQVAELKHQGRRAVVVDDEVWATVGTEQYARWLQARIKLCREYGLWNILIAHRIGDLRAQAADGTVAAKIASDLLADIQTRVVFRQDASQAGDARNLLRFNPGLVEQLPHLAAGRAIWSVAGRKAIVQHVVAGHEMPFCNTDAAMAAE